MNSITIKGLLLLIAIFQIHTNYAQNSIKSRPIYKDGDKNKGIEKLVFTDEQGAKLGEFDVESNNPYSNLLAKGSIKSNQSIKSFEINDGTKIGDIIHSSANYKHPEVINDEIKFIENSVSTIKSPNGQIGAVVYRLDLYDSNEKKKAAEATIEVLNKSGQKIKQIRIGTDLKTPTFTDDQKFLCYRYGGIVNHDGYKIFDEGVRIYDINTGQEILNLVGREDYVVSAPFVFQGMIIFSERNGIDEKYFVVKPNERAYYTYIFTYEERQKLKDITKDGLVLEDGTADRILGFESDFSKTNF